MSDTHNSQPADLTNPSAASVSLTNDGLNIAVSFVLNHLRRESEYLDTVIQCSLKMKDVLRERRPHSAALAIASEEPFPSETPSAPSPPDGHEQLTTLRGDLARQFVPVLEGRQQMTSAMRDLKSLTDATPSVTALAPNLNEPARSELKQLRADIRQKLNTIRAITMGNQAVLIYNMDFYNRLINGTTETPPAKAYNASGQVTKQIGSGMLQKNC